VCDDGSINRSIYLVAIDRSDNPDATAEEGAEWLSALATDLHVPLLGEYGLTPDQFHKVAEVSAASSSMKGNPVQLSIDQLKTILKQAT